MSGSGAPQFLQGLVTQDVVGGKAGGHDSVASLFLNPKGRVISDAIFHFPKNDESIILDVPQGNADSISSMLARHKLRLPLTIEKMEDECVCADWGLVNDPRSSELPGRRIVRINSEDIDATVPGRLAEYRKRRLLAGIPEGPEEVPKDSIVPIFYNFDLFNCISFTKGCYTGQELVTRTLRRGVVRKRLFPIRIRGKMNVGDAVFYADEKIGEVIACEEEVGLAQLSIPADALNDRSQIQHALEKLDMKKFSLRSDDVTSDVELVVPRYMK